MNKYNRIIPFNEFWIDCYSTAIFSILKSKYTVDSRYLYQNNYTYEYTQNVRTGMGRVYITLDLNEIKKKVFCNKITHDFTKDPNIIETLKSYIDDDKIIFLGIDMYYGIPDTSQWHKHHIHHNILVEGYDDDKSIMYVLETGDSGYKEYEISYVDLEKAAKEFIFFIHESEIFEVCNNAPSFTFDIEKMRENAINTISSIDKINSIIDGIWHVDEEKLLSMRDEIQSHLSSIRNRQNVNKLLFESMYDEKKIRYYVQEFERLYREYDSFIYQIDKACENKTYYADEIDIKNVFRTLLFREKTIWTEFVNDKKLE